MNVKPHIILILASLIFTSTLVSARDLYHANESSLQISRYVDLLPGPTDAQRNPLHIVLPNVVFNQKIKSVGQAIQFLLKDTGYKLTRFHPDKRVHQMFRLSLPKIHRRMGPITLEQALKTLSGEPWNLAVDPINRLISFQLPDLYKNPVHYKVATKTNKINRITWNKKKVNKIQRQYKKALKPKRVSIKRKHTPHKKVIKVVRNSPKKKALLELNKLTWADLPKELR